MNTVAHFENLQFECLTFSLSLELLLSVAAIFPFFRIFQDLKNYLALNFTSLSLNIILYKSFDRSLFDYCLSRFKNYKKSNSFQLPLQLFSNSELYVIVNFRKQYRIKI
ncbi:hypothetical protein BpHYR1_000373 [Brachionus plicatilis]|uniref:Uncharacterized protein n=1 Tax=Brachionus plicatilis TaxID=10195 RepID=A0A3M7Q5H2_BRAPC|nr:hypothetical protein BpHYR1_000373 [Brachionus plicatilis]